MNSTFFCKDIGYTKMKIPNLLNHDTLAEVSNEMIFKIRYTVFTSPNILKEKKNAFSIKKKARKKVFIETIHFLLNSSIVDH